MKNKTCTFLCILLALAGKAQTWAWATATTGNATGVVNGVCADGAGNVFEAGYFYGSTINFGSFVLTKQGPSTSGSGCFIVKYDPNGAVLWAKTFGGVGYDMIRGACSDSQGNFLVTGSMGTQTAVIGTVTLTGNGAGIFIAKFDGNGNTLWAKRFTATNVDEGMGICTDSQDNVCISGHFGSSSISMGTVTINGSAAQNVLVAKFDASGNLLWAQQPTGSSMGAESHAIACDAADNLFVSGFFSCPSLTFTNAVNVTRVGGQNGFIAKYNSSGTAQWAKSSAGNNSDYFYSVSTDGAGNAYVLGNYTSSVVTIGSFSLSQVAQEDIMYAKYDANGAVLWAKKITGTGRDVGYSVHSKGGSVFITGSMGSLGYAPGAAVTIGTLTLNPPPGYTDPMFMAQLDLNGNVVYTAALASGGYNKSRVYCDGRCHAYLGSNYANGNSGSMVIGSTTLPYSMYENVFIARLDFVCQTVGIEDVAENGSSVLLYPNPANGSFRIELPQGAGNFQLEIYTTLGQLVHRQTLEGGDQVIQAASLTTGVYHYKVSGTAGAVKTGKLMMQ